MFTENTQHSVHRQKTTRELLLSGISEGLADFCVFLFAEKLVKEGPDPTIYKTQNSGKAFYDLINQDM